MPAVQLNGFRAELSELEAHPRISVRVHITQSSAAVSPACSPGVETPVGAKESLVVEELDKEIDRLEKHLEKEVQVEKICIEKKESVVIESPELLPPSVVPGRPNVMETVCRVVGESTESSQLLVAGTSLPISRAPRPC